MIVKGKDRQTLSDIALQYAGTHEAIFSIARENDVSLDANVYGMELNVATVEPKIVAYYNNNRIIPASEPT